MKTWKRLNVMVVLAVLLMMAVPSVTNAGVIEGSSRTSAPEIEITGALEEMGDGYVVVDGQTVEVGAGAEIKGPLSVGDVVKVHVRVDSQGNWVAREIEPADDDTFDDNSNATDRLDNNNGDDMTNANDDDISNANDDGMSNANDDDMSNANEDDDDNGNSNNDDHSNANDDDNDDHDNSSDDDHSNDNDDDDDDDNSDDDDDDSDDDDDD
jgi:hypothetical protein